MPAPADLITAYEELVEYRPAYEEAKDMYAGQVGETYASERVKRLLARARADDIEEFNYAHIPVDTIANRLEITSVTVVRPDADDQTTEGGTGGVRADSQNTKTPDAEKGARVGEGAAPKAADAEHYSQAQAALDKLREDNQLDAESAGLHHKVSRDGDCYLIVWPASDDKGKVTAVDMRVNDALTTRVIYDVEDPLKVAYAIKSWTYDEVDAGGNKIQRTRATLYYDNRVERWISKPDKKAQALCDPDAWLPYEPVGKDGKREPAVKEHDYGRVPVFHFRNDRPYGQPEHRYAYGPQQMLNKLVMAQAVAVDFQSFPQRYLLMDPSADQTMANFLDPNHPEDDDDPEGDANASNLSADPSSVWKLFGAKSTGQYDPASPDTFLKPFDRYVQAMAELTETPLYRFGSAFAQTPSGAAQRAADTPTVNKVENRQSSYDATWEDAYQFALKLLGFDVTVSVAWKPAEQATDFEAWSVVGAKVDAGVPRRQALIETGYTPDQVDEWLGGEAAMSALLQKKVDLITGVANALQSLGAAVAMGVIHEDQVGALVSSLVGEVQQSQAQDTAPDSGQTQAAETGT